MIPHAPSFTPSYDTGDVLLTYNFLFSTIVHCIALKWIGWSSFRITGYFRSPLL